ncbi:hypothetical protein BV133_2196 [Blastochloris viridis]|uniref:Uncharacterized protein n=1 Tax=Blastochloris viridis TaxID=1079 RepID=A0A182D2V9_BLAVI|nr:hypothetical protein BV133_2196 [Blastochloris viridis]
MRPFFARPAPNRSRRHLQFTVFWNRGRVVGLPSDPAELGWAAAVCGSAMKSVTGSKVIFRKPYEATSLNVHGPGTRRSENGRSPAGMRLSGRRDAMSGRSRRDRKQLAEKSLIRQRISRRPDGVSPARSARFRMTQVFSLAKPVAIRRGFRRDCFLVLRPWITE